MKRIFLTIVLIGAFFYGFSQDFLSNEKRLDQLRVFAETFEPVYIIGTDTMAVARVLMPPDSLNSFLYHCVATKNSEAYKYCFLIIMKLTEEFVSVNKQDYDFCGYKNNGVVDLVYFVIDRENKDDNCFVTTSLDVYQWLKKNKKIYRRYSELRNQMRRVEGVLRNHRRLK